MTESIIKQCLKKDYAGKHLDGLKNLWQDAIWPSSKQEVWRYAKLHWLNEPWALVVMDTTPFVLS